MSAGAPHPQSDPASVYPAEVVLSGPPALAAVHTVGVLTAAFGGPSRSVTKLCDALAEAGAAVDLVASRSGPGVEIVRPGNSRVRLRLADQDQGDGFLRGAYSPFGRAVSDVLAKPEAAVVHNHGLWIPTNRAAALAARAAGQPLVVSPKGMLSEWSLGESRLKKLVAWHLYQRRTLQTAAALQVTAGAEADDVRRLGLRQPVAVIPHGVDGPPPGALCERSESRKRTALFLSRIHPKKGLPDLVAAWASVRPAGWRLVVAGPDDGGHRAEVERQVRAAGLDDVVSFPGPVNDEEKWALYGAADLFVLPTLSENFGIVVAEALAAGVPVLTTHEAPWRALVDHRCGWWVETGAESVAAALREATSAPPDALRAMGERGRSYVQAELSWARSARDHLALYQWLLGQGDRPACVVME